MRSLFSALNSRTLNLFFPLADFLHIYQLEEYDNKSFLKWSLPRIYKRNLQKVGRLTWTQKAKLLYLLSLSLIILSSLVIFLIGQDSRLSTAALGINSFITPLWLVAAKTLLFPGEFLLKSRSINNAKKKLSGVTGLRVIAVCGSVGKTTTRHFIVELLKTKYKTFTTSGNINTALGIANQINSRMASDTEVFVMELGEYKPGDLLKICKLAAPEVLVFTKIGSQHLERFGDQTAINEEFLSLKSLGGVKQIFVAKNNLIAEELKGSNVRIVTSGGHTNLDRLKAKSFEENLELAVSVAQYMSIGKSVIQTMVPTLSPLPQRLTTTVQNGITIIDDSYNISLESASNALDFVRLHKGRKVLVTGGIVDQGEKSDRVNKKFGAMAAKIFDVILVAENNYFSAITKGIKAARTEVEIVNSESPTHTTFLLSKLLKNGDVVLIQNELPEVYWH